MCLLLAHSSLAVARSAVARTRRQTSGNCTPCCSSRKRAWALQYTAPAIAMLWRASSRCVPPCGAQRWPRRTLTAFQEYEVAIDPSELEHLDEDALKQKYEEQVEVCVCVCVRANGRA